MITEFTFTRHNGSSATLMMGGLDWKGLANELMRIPSGERAYITVHRKGKPKSREQLAYYYAVILPEATKAFEDDNSTKIEFWTTSVKTTGTKKITLPMTETGVDSFFKLCYAAYCNEYKDKAEMNMAECAAFEDYCIRWLAEHKECHIPPANPDYKETQK